LKKASKVARSLLVRQKGSVYRRWPMSASW